MIPFFFGFVRKRHTLMTFWEVFSWFFHGLFMAFSWFFHGFFMVCGAWAAAWGALGSDGGNGWAAVGNGPPCRQVRDPWPATPEGPREGTSGLHFVLAVAQSLQESSLRPCGGTKVCSKEPEAAPTKLFSRALKKVEVHHELSAQSSQESPLRPCGGPKVCSKEQEAAQTKLFS